MRSQFKRKGTSGSDGKGGHDSDGKEDCGREEKGDFGSEGRNRKIIVQKEKGVVSFCAFLKFKRCPFNCLS